MNVCIAFIILFIFIICSALISGSEVAFFSLTPNNVNELKEENSSVSNRILALKEKPKELLATILVFNNFINIGIVIISDYIIRMLLPDITFQNWAEYIGALLHIQDSSIMFLGQTFHFLFTIVIVTFFLVLFGEITPKVYANLNNISFSRRMAKPLEILSRILSPISGYLVKWISSIEAKVDNTNSISANREDLDRAIELAISKEENPEEEVDILKGIVKFGDVTVKQIMCSRVDVISLDKTHKFKEVLNTIKDSGYSRIPVYEEDFDSIIGMLYVKDLLGHTEDTSFTWQNLIRENVLFVPESKKINELLKEFQQKRMHMAIVVDEYGGSAGIVTLEDIMEEVIGDIKDEFDDEYEVEYIKLDEYNYIFEGKSLLNDVCRIIGKDTETFDESKGDADSLAGLILEIVGQIPKEKKVISYEGFTFTIMSANNRRIEKIKIKIHSDEE